MTCIHFVVHGEPKPAGSKRAFSRKTKDGRTKTIVTHANPTTPEWMGLVGQVARQHYDGELLEGPIALTLFFYRPRPLRHFGVGRNSKRLKASAPAFPTMIPDTIKLARAVEDALSGVLWKNDSQNVDLHLHKRYGKSYYVEVTVEVLE